MLRFSEVNIKLRIAGKVYRIFIIFNKYVMAQMFKTTHNFMLIYSLVKLPNSVILN